MGDTSLVLIALLPIFFWLAVFILIIVFIVRLLKNRSGAVNEAFHQQLADLTRAQEDSIERQELLTEELKEVKNRLQTVEKILRKVE